MIGVVVWSSRSREQAVIWCDDHAALAYLAGREHFSAESPWPEPGDMVELQDALVGDLRCARAVRPLGDSTIGQLPAILQASAQRATPPGDAACEVIPLRRAAG